MTLCFSTLGCGELDLEDVLALAAARRIPSIELRTLGGHNQLAGYLEARYGAPDRLRDRVEDSGIRIASLDSSCRLAGATRGDMTDLLALAPWAAAVGAGGIRVFDGLDSGDAAELASLGAFLDEWRNRDTGVELMIETHDALARPEVLERFVDRYPLARILWDTFHTWKEGDEMPSATWARVCGRTSHLHVKDGDGRGYVPPGEGRFPFDDLIGALRLDGFSGVVSLEWERHWFPQLPPINVALDGFARAFAGQGTRETT